MNKVTLFVIASLIVVSTTFVSAFAAEIQDAKGTITSINKAKGTFVFTPAEPKGAKGITLKADKAMLSSFSDNTNVKVTYDNGTATKIVKDRKAKVPVGC